MRPLLAITLVAIAGTAGAHPLGPEQSLFDQLLHQLLGGHHLPLLLIAVVAGAVTARALLRRKQ